MAQRPDAKRPDGGRLSVRYGYSLGIRQKPGRAKAPAGGFSLTPERRPAGLLVTAEAPEFPALPLADIAAPVVPALTIDLLAIAAGRLGPDTQHRRQASR